MVFAGVYFGNAELVLPYKRAAEYFLMVPGFDYDQRFLKRLSFLRHADFTSFLKVLLKYKCSAQSFDS